MSRTVDVLLRIPATWTDETVAKFVLRYGVWDERLHDYSMCRGKWRHLACTCYVETLWRIAREQPGVSQCGHNPVMVENRS